MEGMFAFFLESTFLGLLVWGERRLGPKRHFLAALALFLGSWLSGYFIVATNAFMQHPVGYQVAADGTLQLADFWAYLLNPWAVVQYLHNMMGAVVTGSFVVAAVGAYWTLRGEHARAGRPEPEDRRLHRRSWPACWWPSPPATSRASWWPGTSSRPWPPWRAAGGAGRTPT